MRLVVALVIALLVNFGLFMLMQHMTRSEGVDKRVTEDIRLLDFVRLKRDQTEPETKKRELPKKPPPPKQPPPPETVAPKTNKPKALTPKIDVPQIDVPMNITGGPYLGDFAKVPKASPAPTQTTAPAFGNEVVPLVRIPPKYPRMAERRGIEGVVTVSFTITIEGTVKDPVVVKATPENVFDKEALKAVLKWKFKPERVDGRLVERQATQEIEFKLAR